MPLRKKAPILLFFYAQELTQEQVTQIEEAFSEYDVYFRKVLRNNQGDIVENFDAVAGEVPAVYIAAADKKSSKVFDYDLKTSTLGTGEIVDQSGSTDLSGTQGTTPAEPTKTVTPPADVVKPTDAPSASPSSVPPPPPSKA